LGQVEAGSAGPASCSVAEVDQDVLEWFKAQGDGYTPGAHQRSVADVQDASERALSPSDDHQLRPPAAVRALVGAGDQFDHLRRRRLTRTGAAAVPGSVVTRTVPAAHRQEARRSWRMRSAVTEPDASVASSSATTPAPP
jgi:hypothetical protein